MANVAVYNMEGKEVGSLELNDAVFGVEVNEHLVHMAVLQQLANNRQGTQKAKTRSEVRGGGRKPWRQKGTGHARQGSTRDSIKTKNVVQVLNNLKVEKALVVLNDMDTNVIKSASNVPTVKTAQTNELNVFDVLKYDTVVVTKDAVKTIEEVYA